MKIQIDCYGFEATVTAPCGGARFEGATPSGMSEANRLRESQASISRGESSKRTS